MRVTFALTPNDLLRGRMTVGGDGRPPGILLNLVAYIAAFGCLYGAAMGTFAGVGGDRILQVLYSAVKVPILLLCTFAISLPSFFVVNTLLGLRNDFPQALRALMGAQAVLTIVLASLAPYTLVWYGSSDEYEDAILFNAALFGMASLIAQVILRRQYRPLIARNRTHLHMLRAWIVIYAFVGIQMAWVLRPFIGNPTGPVTFFRANAWGNAYLELFDLVVRALRN